VLAGAFALAACSADPPSETATTTAPSDAAPATDEACQELASSTAQAHGDRVFVESGGTTYMVDGVRSLPDNRVIVETTVDQPELVGYPQVQFLSQCVDGEV